MFGFLMGTLQKFKDNEDVAKSSDKVTETVFFYFSGTSLL